MLNLLLPYYDTILSKLTVITESSIPTVSTKSSMYKLIGDICEAGRRELGRGGGGRQADGQPAREVCDKEI